VKEKTIYVETDFEQVQAFCQFAEKYKSDFLMPKMKHFLEMDVKDVYKWVVNAYSLEQDEINLRPAIYFDMVQQTGKALDCDDAFIFWVALLRCAGVSKDDILVCEAQENGRGDYCHIFAAVNVGGKTIWLDNLPGTAYGVLSYPKSWVRVTRLSEYI